MWYKICWHKSYIALLYLQGKVAGKGCCCVSVIRVPPHMTWSFFFAVSSSLSLSMFCFAFRVLPCTCTCVSWQAQKWWAVSPSRRTVWEMDSPSLKSMRRCWHTEPVAVRLWRHVSYPWLLPHHSLSFLQITRHCQPHPLLALAPNSPMTMCLVLLIVTLTLCISSFCTKSKTTSALMKVNFLTKLDAYFSDK